MILIKDERLDLKGLFNEFKTIIFSTMFYSSSNSFEQISFK